MSVVAVQGVNWIDNLEQNTKANRYFSLETDLPQLDEILRTRVNYQQGMCEPVASLKGLTVLQ